jgi:hypothetical protein
MLCAQSAQGQSAQGRCEKPRSLHAKEMGPDARDTSKKFSALVLGSAICFSECRDVKKQGAGKCVRLLLLRPSCLSAYPERDPPGR